MNNIIDELIKLSNKAYKGNEVPVGCIIEKDGKIISKAYNKKQKSHLTINHAEIIAINKAQKKLKDWRLNDCNLYVTLEPCKMCKEVIKQSRINNVYYLVKSKYNNEKSSKIGYKTIKCENFVKNNYIEKLGKFFSNKR